MEFLQPLKESNRTTRPVRRQPHRPIQKNPGEVMDRAGGAGGRQAAGCMRGADLRGN